MRREVVRVIVAAVAVAVALWIADAAVRTLVLRDGGFVAQLLTPSPGVLLARIPLLLLGVVILLSVRGIRQLQAAREEAVDERRRLRELYDYTTDAIVILDRDLRVMYLNKAAERIGGKKLTEAVGWPCYKAIVGRDEPCEGCGAGEVFRTAQPCMAMKYEITERGNENWLEQRWYPIFDDDGNVEAVYEVARDITERKLLERELAACHAIMDARRREE